MSDTLSTLRALEAAATPGLWYPRWGGEPGYITAAGEPLGEIYAAKTDAHRDPNLDLVCTARNALPALLRVIEAARAWEDAEDESIAQHVMDPNDEAGEMEMYVRRRAAYDALRAALAALEGGA